MSHISRFTSIVSTVVLAAGLAACDTLPMGPQGQRSSYPNQPQPYPAQYPNQYPSQYPNQYPSQGQYPAQNPQGNSVEYGRVTNMEVFQVQEPGNGGLLRVGDGCRGCPGREVRE